jgi:hypothetical protein
MIGLLQGTSVFVSTITITAIALDRRRLIVGSEQGPILQNSVSAAKLSDEFWTKLHLKNKIY